MQNEKDSYVIDVVKDRTFQNQSEAYNAAYSKWRADTNNPYAYRFVHDTRENSYVAGEGFLDKKPDVAEHLTLFKCLGLLGVVMLVMLAFDLFQFILFGNDSVNNVYFSERYAPNNIVDVTEVLSYFGVSVLRYLAAFAVFKIFTKIPYKVIFPMQKTDAALNINAVSLMMMIVVIGRIASYIIAKILGVVNLDSVFCYMVTSDDEKIVLISAFFNCLVLPALCELFFRGIVLQIFRQFGDSFAIIVSSVVCAFSFYDIGFIGFALCSSVMLGIFTIRTGTIRTAVVMHITSSSLRYIVSLLEMANGGFSRVYELIICTLVIGFAIVAYMRITETQGFSFNISGSEYEMSFTKKLKALLSTSSLALWLVCSIVMTIICARII